MMRIGSISEKQVCDGVIKDAFCPKCETVISAPMLRNEFTGKILFVIPFIRTYSPYYTICPCCRFQYGFRRKKGKEIKKSQSVQLLYEECKYFLDKQRESTSNLVKRSNKKVWLGAILAFFLGIFGIQHLHGAFILRKPGRHPEMLMNQSGIAKLCRFRKNSYYKLIALPVDEC